MTNASSITYGSVTGAVTYYICDEVTVLVNGQTFTNVTCDGQGNWTMFTTQCVGTWGRWCAERVDYVNQMERDREGERER